MIKEKLLSQIEMEIDWNKTLCIFCAPQYRFYRFYFWTFVRGTSDWNICKNITAPPPPSSTENPWLRSSPTAKSMGSRAARADTHNRVSRKNIITSSANRPSRSNPIRSVSHAEYPCGGIIFKIDSNLAALTLASSFPLRRVWSRSRAWISW